MSCYAQGRCRFCAQKHTLPVFGKEETAHDLIQRTNLKLIVLNTVCSTCIAAFESYLKDTKLRLPCGGCEGDGDDRLVLNSEAKLPSDGKSYKEEWDKETRRKAVEQHGTMSNRVTNNNRQSGRKKIRSYLMCDFCEKPFTHAGDLRKHRRKHTGEQPYECPSCRQRFSHASNLARHRRVHSGVRPFSCHHCGRTFARRDKLSSHSQRQCCKVATGIREETLAAEN